MLFLKPFLQIGSLMVLPEAGCDPAEQIFASGFQAVYEGYGFDTALIEILLQRQCRNSGANRR
jgi:hypothetical protein